jgi:hypothetical protein
MILPDTHPLAHVHAIGPDSTTDRQRLAASVVGFALGDRVVCPDGRVGTVQTINPADIEVGAIFSASLAPTWYRPDELRVRETPTSPVQPRPSFWPTITSSGDHNGSQRPPYVRKVMRVKPEQSLKTARNVSSHGLVGGRGYVHNAFPQRPVRRVVDRAVDRLVVDRGAGRGVERSCLGTFVPSFRTYECTSTYFVPFFVSAIPDHPLSVPPTLPV